MNSVYFALFCLLAAVTPVSANPLVPGDFAYGCPLPVAEGAGLHSVDLPPVVYEKATRADLGDLRVFNAAGEVVPHAVRQIAAESRQTRTSIPFFPLPGERQLAMADLSMRVVRNPEGAIVTVETGQTGATPSQTTSSYLLDTTKLDAHPTELELAWSGPAGLLTVSLAQSRDLAHWVPLIDRAVLADLSFNGGTVTVRRIRLPGSTLPYLRLDCIERAEPVQIREVVAVAGTPVHADEWQWLPLQAMAFKEEQGQRLIEYRLDARITATALRLGFPTANSLLRAQVESRRDSGEAWRPVTQADFYRLDLQGNSLANSPVLCPPISDGQWRIVVLVDGAGLGGQASLPKLELGWRPAQVVFLGRGSGPYTLAFGSTKAAGEVPAHQDTLVLSAPRDSRAEEHIRRIEPGPMLTLGGDQALRPLPRALAWKTILLWAVLVAGVALLALMVRSIVKEMRKSP